MMLEGFFEKFDTFADAPGAVAKLRELVLELAVQGRLVAQSSDDEPSFKQLERIAAKKSINGRVARLTAGRARGTASVETQTHVPDGWERASLAELVTVLNGRAYSKDELLAAGTPVLRVGNLFTSKHWYYSDLELEPDKYCDKGDLLFAWSASFGPFIWPGPKAIYHYHIWKLELHSEADLNRGFLYWFLQNKTQEIKRAGHGVSMLHMTKEKMEKLEVMVPPLAEQQRIVAKVDELMALCDRLEAQQQERETRHAALARASLARFADAPTPENLEYLFHPAYAIAPGELRKAVLTLAVRGRLVPQDPNDERTEESLERVSEDAKQAICDGVIRRHGLVAPTDDSILSELPSGWRWTRLTEVTRPVQYAIKRGPFGSAIRKDMFTSTGFKVYEQQHAISGDFKRGRYYISEAKFDELSAFELHPGEVLVSCSGTVGKVAVVPEDIEPGIINQALLKLSLHQSALLNEYFLILFPAFFMETDTLTNLSGTAQKNIPGMDVLKAMPFPLPPVAEQFRIVTRVDQLTALVDQLEAHLDRSHAKATKLLDAIVAELGESQ